MSNMEVKSYQAEFKAAREGDKGIVTALVSVFNNIDLGGDRMLPGAFTKTIQDWQAKGDPVPVIWSHEWDKPEAHIGFVDPADLKETELGLEVKMQYDLDRPFAEQVFHLQKTRRVTQFSFGYYVTDQQLTKEGNTEIREIKAVDLFEVGPTLLGMNPATQLLEAASALNGIKPKRTLTAKSEDALKEARDIIDAVLAGSEQPAEPATEPAENVVNDAAPAETDAPTESAGASRDSGITINPEQVIDLLTKPRHTED
jgi:HK97 family phage prohead protease